MITPQALKSPWVKFEIDCANRYNKHPIAVCPDDFDDKDLPTGLRDKLSLKYRTVEGLRSRLAAMREDWGYTAYIPAGGFGGAKVEFCLDIPKALCQIGDRPMLFHIIDSLDASPVTKVIVINEKIHAPDFISYVTSLEYPSRGDLARDGCSHGHFKGKVACVETEAKN